MDAPTADDIPADVPYVVGWVDADGEDDGLHLRVCADGQAYDRVDADLDALLATEQYNGEIGRVALTLLALRDRALADDQADAADADATATQPSPTPGGS